MQTERRRGLADGFVFPEGPRWHAGELWFSDIHAHQVIAVDPSGHARVAARFEDRPSGLGFLPDGSLVVCLMRSKRVMRVHNGEVEVLADLGDYPWDFTNDCVTDGGGRTYLGFRSDIFKLPSGADRPLPHGIVLVEPDGRSRVVAEDMAGPNGSVVTPDGRTLIVAETHAGLLTAFTIQEDGSLTGRRLFADTSPAKADGICLDAEGAIWLGSTTGMVRVIEGGDVVDGIPIESDGHVVACALGARSGGHCSCCSSTSPAISTLAAPPTRATTCTARCGGGSRQPKCASLAPVGPERLEVARRS
jgi:sugar lactone lactonase YvrE